MPDRSDDPTARLVDVNWDDPRLRELLEATAQLHIEHRGDFAPRAVLLREAEGGAARHALLVAESDDGARTLLTDTALERGAVVVLDRGGERRELAAVDDCRHGLRHEDSGRTVHIVVLRRIRSAGR
jgi:hypothetical protein